MKAAFSKQVNVRHRVFQRNPLSGYFLIALQLEQAVKNGVIGSNQSCGKFFGIDFRQRRH